MKILHLISSLNPAGGGPQMVAMRLAAAQARLGHELTLAAYDEPAAMPAIEKEMADIAGAQAVKLQFIPPGGKLERFLATSATKHLQPIIPSMQYVHIHTLWERILSAGAKIARAAQVPYVFTPHGMLDPYSLSQKRLKKKIALALGVKSTLNHASFLHTLNADEKALIEPLGLRCPMEVIPNGVFVEELEQLPAAGTFYASHPELENRPYVLFLGRLHHKKGLDYLADAFAKVAAADKELLLVVAGPDGGARQPFIDQIDKAGIRRRVHLIPPIFGRDKWAAMVDAQCFCLPSRQEGFSMAITEAMASSVPVIISENCHFPEVAQAGAGIVLPLRADAFAQAILKIRQDETLRRQMGAAAKELVATHYTWPRIAAQSIEAYQKHR